QSLSKIIESRSVYSHTGWRLFGEEWVYLHSGGAIGCNGLTGDIEVDLGSSKLNDYVLPDPPSKGVLQSSVQSCLKLLKLAPDRIIFPAFDAIFRAPLSEMISNDSSLYFAGPTGAGKTQLIALMQSFYGSGFHGTNLPGNWSATGNSLERLAFMVKDAIFTIDDFAPNGTTFDVARSHKEADRIFRGAGNQAGRGRMKADGSLRPENYPRSLVVGSGEDIPKGQSVRARMGIIEISPGDIDFCFLTGLQQMAADGVFAKVMAGFVKWLAPQVDELKSTLSKKKNEIREEARQSNFSHNRTPDIVANLTIGLEMFLKFALETCGVDESEKAEIQLRGWNALSDMSRLQMNFMAGEEPARRFLDLLSAALINGTAHVVDADSGEHPRDGVSPESWGWRGKATEEGDDEKKAWNPLGSKIGWVENDDLYLEPDSAYAVVQKMARDQGTSLPVAQRTLWKRLDEKSLIASKDAKRSRLGIRMVLSGEQRTVLHLKTSALSA
ncbi:MAG: hypothetical protein P8M70_12325, partial [Verrucomicrobiota bacterium]|nr:hypothetical protein [Verrucomicrobiota bacterium]